MASTAQVSLVGYLGRDAETRYTPNGAMVVNFSVATTRRRGDEETTTWFNVAAFGKLAEILSELSNNGALDKGAQVYVTGELYERTYVDKDGYEAKSLDVAAATVLVVGERKGNGNGAPVKGVAKRRPAAAPPNAVNTANARPAEQPPF